MIWPQLNRTVAGEIFESLFPAETVSCPAPTGFTAGCDTESARVLTRLRDAMVNAFETTHKDGKKGFGIDCEVSLALYAENQIPLRVASSMPFWYWISLKLVPDLVFRRYQDREMSKEQLRMRYFSRSNRVWPFMLWWGVHLTWQGTAENTGTMLRDSFSVAAIETLLDRGGYGYRVELFRCIAAYFADIVKKYVADERDVLRAAMTINTSKIVTIEPSFYAGQTEGYVKDLFGPFIATLKPRTN